MKNTIGNNLHITIFGESHGPYIGAVLDGLKPGIKIDYSFIDYMLSLRRPAGKISTSRVEADQYQIISGVFEDKTTGSPLCIIIPNSSQHSKDYSLLSHVARPGHADFSAQCKYHGYQDYRGGGHFSGRITAALVASAAIVIPVLKEKGITIGSHIKKLADVCDKDFDIEKLADQLEELNKKTFAVLDDNSGALMVKEIEAAASEGDSVGGIIETAITGLPAGLGEPFFDSIESQLSHALFSIPGIKGVQFGAGFDKVCSRGSNFNDSFRIQNNKIITETNNNGGINGGITNGMPVLFSCAVKPTPSIYKKQNTVDFKDMKDVELELTGRHDPAIIHRARVVVDSMVALVIYDILAGRFGTDLCNMD
ncbi:MAG: chorismate synthase [Sphaerochaetaceae bacterium]|nr:chorismate synthase [Sphaerochaetaceae bacterium]